MGIERTLKRAEVFLGLDDSELAKIAALPSCREEDYQAGAVIFKSGADTQFLYLLREGQVSLTIDVQTKGKQPSTRVVVHRVTTGGVFGWSAVVAPRFYTLTAVCEAPSQVVAIGGDELLALFDREYHIGYKVFKSLSQIIGARLRDLEQVLLKGQRWPLLEK